MTYQNDLNTNRRSEMRDDASYTHWIIGGVVTLAIVIAAAAFISTGSNRDLDLPQITTTVPAPASSTTGSDTPANPGQPPAFSCEQFCTVSSLGIRLT